MQLLSAALSVPFVVEPAGHARQLAAPPVLALTFWYVPREQAAHAPSEPRLVGVPALYAVWMYLPAAHDIFVAVVKPVSSGP